MMGTSAAIKKAAKQSALTKQRKIVYTSMQAKDKSTLKKVTLLEINKTNTRSISTKKTSEYNDENINSIKNW